MIFMQYRPTTILLALFALISLSGCQTMTSENLDLAHKAPYQATSEDKNLTTQLASINYQLDTSDIAHPLEYQLPEPPEPAAKPANNLWLRIADGLQLNIPNDKRVVVQRDWYAKHQAYLDRVADRAQPFLYFIVEEIEKRNMPMELALLPIVESAFDAFAYSHGRASGMWQFIPGTGKRFKLKQNWWYDGRRDVYASTHAALDYLTYLNKLFGGNWLHALAAYNSGEGNVQRAIRRNKRRNKPTDFWHLKLPRETSAYVPKLLALAQLLKEDDKFDLNWKPINNQPVIARVDIGSQLDLALAADLADMSVEEIYRYNPGFNRWSTPPKGPHYLLLPLDKAEAFQQRLAETDPADRVRWIRYSIRSGDSLSTIAKKHNTTVGTLRSVNRISGTQITAGDTLLIPTASQSRHSYSLSADQRLADKKSVKRSGTKHTYQVQPGDSFWKISRQYGVNHRTLAKWNGMAPRDPLKVGQSLVIWTKRPAVAIASAPANNVALQKQQRLRKVNYRVRQGDSLARISSKFAVTINDLKRWNSRISKKKYLQPGDRITLYVDVTNQSSGN